MTLERDLADTVSCLKSGIPIGNLNRLRRVRTMTTTDIDTASHYRDLVERVTPVLVEIRRAASGGTKMQVHDDDIAAAVLVLEPDAKIEHYPVALAGREFWTVETTEWRCYTWRRPATLLGGVK